MTTIRNLFLPAYLLAICIGCSSTARVQKVEEKKPAESTAFRLYVTNEVSGT